jgi:prenylcysteine oxidase/farnesylcysteine lyase
MYNIAIIGGGAAGCGAAWQLYKRLGNEAQLTIFEREEHVGGRAWDTTFAGCHMEIGGVLFHSTGKLTMEMMEFTGAKEAQPSLSIDGKNETYAFWTNRGFPVLVHTSLASMAAGILKHVGIPSALRVTNRAVKMAKQYEAVYDQLREHAPFATPDELFETLGLLEPTRISTADYFRDIKVNDRMAFDVVEAITHNMYNQGAEMNALASLVGLAGAGLAGGYLFVIEGGNWTLYDKMIKKAGITLKASTKVDKILITSAEVDSQATAKSKAGVETSESAGAGWDSGTGRHPAPSPLPQPRPRYELQTAEGEHLAFDAVILAAPPALADLSIELDGRPFALAEHPYQQVQTTLVVGDLRPEYFGQKPDTRMPSTIFTASSAPAPFKSIGTTGFSPDYNSRIYKIFSADHVMTEEELNQIFVKILDTYVHVWRGAYPVLTPGIKHLPFELNPGLYFANALETIAGSIEVETVSGVNAANLCEAYLRS